MRFVRDALITIAILVVVFVIVGYASIGNMFSATARPGRMESAAAIRLRNLSIPAEARRARNPLEGDKDAWRDALDHFGDHCAVCHGIDGRGGGELAPNLYPRVPDMTQPRTQNLTDGEISYIVSNGVRWTGMPAWKNEHTPDETWHLVSLIRHLHALTPFDIRQIEAASGTGHEHGEQRHGKDEKNDAGAQAPKAAALDVNAIAQALGRQGQTIGEVYKVGFPRTDLDVSVGGVKIRPGLALGSWCAFKASGDHAVLDGDLVLVQAELSPVISALQQNGLAITAVHNHLVNEVPRVMYVHFWGQGDGATLARGLRSVLEKTKTPLAAPPAATTANQAPGFDAAKIEQMLGLKGSVSGGVLSLSKPRPERITMMGVALPPAMGMATAINIQDAGGGTVAATGDFVLIDEEVNAVAAALRAHGIDVTALHNHMLFGSPQLYFMHFWAHDTADRVAAGLKAALDKTAK